MMVIKPGERRKLARGNVKNIQEKSRSALNFALFASIIQ